MSRFVITPAIACIGAAHLAWAGSHDQSLEQRPDFTPEITIESVPAIVFDRTVYIPSPLMLGPSSSPILEHQSDPFQIAPFTLSMIGEVQDSGRKP